MEVLNLFQQCANHTLSIKQAFSFMGLSDVTLKSKPFEEMDERMVLACLINWIINQMPSPKVIKIKLRVEQEAYLVTIRKNKGHVTVLCIKKLPEIQGEANLYHWNKETTYDTLTTEQIESALRIAENPVNQDEVIETAEGEMLTKPVSITDEDMELTNEFLEC